MLIVLTYFWLRWVLMHIWLSFTIHYFIFHFKCYSILLFAVCQLLCWAFLYDVPITFSHSCMVYLSHVATVVWCVYFLSNSYAIIFSHNRHFNYWLQFQDPYYTSHITEMTLYAENYFSMKTGWLVVRIKPITWTAGSKSINTNALTNLATMTCIISVSRREN